jgi:DNA-damage-inducible protein J
MAKHVYIAIIAMPESTELACISFEIQNSSPDFHEAPAMATHTSMLHVRIDDDLKNAATEKLASFGLTISDAVRILLTRVVKEGALPAALTADQDAYDHWFREKVREALADTRPAHSSKRVMDEAQALIDRKRRARS